MVGLIPPGFAPGAAVNPFGPGDPDFIAAMGLGAQPMTPRQQRGRARKGNVGRNRKQQGVLQRKPQNIYEAIYQRLRAQELLARQRAGKRQRQAAAARDRKGQFAPGERRAATLAAKSPAPMPGSPLMEFRGEALMAKVPAARAELDARKRAATRGPGPTPVIDPHGIPEHMRYTTPRIDPYAPLEEPPVGASRGRIMDWAEQKAKRQEAVARKKKVAGIRAKSQPKRDKIQRDYENALMQLALAGAAKPENRSGAAPFPMAPGAMQPQPAMPQVFPQQQLSGPQPIAYPDTAMLGPQPGQDLGPPPPQLGVPANAPQSPAQAVAARLSPDEREELFFQLMRKPQKTPEDHEMLMALDAMMQGV